MFFRDFIIHLQDDNYVIGRTAFVYASVDDLEQGEHKCYKNHSIQL